MGSRLNRLLNRVLLGSELFSCIGFDAYVDCVLLTMYADCAYFPDNGKEPVAYAEIVRRFDALGPDRRARAVDEYKDWARFFDTLEGEPREALFADVVVGVMYGCLAKPRGVVLAAGLE